MNTSVLLMFVIKKVMLLKITYKHLISFIKNVHLINNNMLQIKTNHIVECISHYTITVVYILHIMLTYHITLNVEYHLNPF